MPRQADNLLAHGSLSAGGALSLVHIATNRPSPTFRFRAGGTEANPSESAADDRGRNGNNISRGRYDFFTHRWGRERQRTNDSNKSHASIADPCTTHSSAW